MIKRLYCTFILVSLIAFDLSSQPASIDDVKRISGSFIKSIFYYNPRNIASYSFYGTKEEPLIYIVGLKPEGWILISGNKGASPVIGFNYTGNFEFPEENKNNPAWNWISQRSESLKDLYTTPARLENIKWTEGFTEVSLKAVTVDPLISAEWGQGGGWNQFCPEDIDGPDGHTLVGCVGVAMAQALSVFELPESGVGEYTYEHSVYGTISTDYSQSDYSWDLMSDTQPNEYSAKLLYDCATSVRMNFGPEGSSATTSRATAALRTYFSMYENVSYLKRDAFDASQWEAMMRTELINGRPIIYRGRSDDGSSGHAFNVDGVVSDVYFHINWGWTGSRNGYFFLNELNPGTRSYNTSQAAIVNIMPNATSIEPLIQDVDLKIFPNPVTSVIRLSGISPDKISGVKLYSVSGVLLKSLSPALVSEGINTSDLAKGIYILDVILTDNSSVRKKVIKQ